jgi:imidazole glycerol-phosphate synthase subunit HisH
MKVAIINYNMGNLSSVRRSFEEIGVEAIIANHPSALYEADRIVLPGVGAFSEGMDHLRLGGWVEALRDLVGKQHKPILGICLGMQMLATTGYEGKETQGLNLIPGRVEKIDTLGCDERIPHMGWNEVNYTTQNSLFEHIPEASDFYFVHSYAFVTDSPEDSIATVNYGCELAAAVNRKHIFGCQFHPEKSSKAGRQLLKNFMSYSQC